MLVRTYMTLSTILQVAFEPRAAKMSTVLDSSSSPRAMLNVLVVVSTMMRPNMISDSLSVGERYFS
jgi:hypothetical protein